ncbi:methyltransferase domain-containing protein [Methylocapsa polymorpha]|uniref:Methyltransferase domain-containing protein n=1 Tax=Methylocapsa polymorpha TaxID=3080828 RepID=A0ABZ0HS81_9HYPH|nr:methyltransferase domain-containing protein [Methylocapsa sp. RX1]
MEISQDHKIRKKEGYWSNLVEGETGIYKAEAIDELISQHFPDHCDAVLDVGCGTSVIAQTLRKRLGASRMVFMDYDPAVIEEMRKRVNDPTVEWKVGDIFNIGAWEDRFDLILLLDMIHEVYSFYGRPVRDVNVEIDHVRGQQAVYDALFQVARLVKLGGGIIITDNALSPERVPLRIRLRNAKVIKAVSKFLDEYPSRRIAVRWHADDEFSIDSHDFCILLTQYNKIKAGNMDRWNVEKCEIHQYMTIAEYNNLFGHLGFTLYSLVGTPEGASEEWNEDFKVIAGLSAIPEKRISLLAVKHR